MYRISGDAHPNGTEPPPLLTPHPPTWCLLAYVCPAVCPPAVAAPFPLAASTSGLSSATHEDTSLRSSGYCLESPLLILVCFLATQAFLLFLKHTRAIPTPGPLHLTLCLPAGDPPH